MSGQDTFGLSLRRARQHRGVSLADIASQTNVKVELWEDLERNDFTRWPAGIYARTWIRAYADLIGADPNKTVDDFCRWFPQGDRRAEPELRRHADIVGHELAWHGDPRPGDGDRRAAAPAAPPDKPNGIHPRHIRLIAAACDLGVVLILVLAATALLPAGRWPALAIVATLYHAISLTFLGCTPAVWAIDAVARARPELQRRGGVLAFRRLTQPPSAEIPPTRR
jgi:hypothetical protein